MDDSQGKLILCPTPLGNLGDMTLRALDALNSADVVYAEDTRVTGKLLAAYDIKKRLERLDENTMAEQAEYVVDRVLTGDVIVFCSDAGMPGISDPGSRLVDAAHTAGATVEVLPGATAVATAYAASGVLASQFYFGGFFPRKNGERKQLLNELSSLHAALIFYESPKRLAAALQVIADVFPLRQVVVCRELTKLHEEVFRGESKHVAKEFLARSAHGAIKGEVVIVIDAPNKEEAVHQKDEAHSAARERARELKSQTDFSQKDLTKLLQQEFGIARNDAYRIAQES